MQSREGIAELLVTELRQLPGWMTRAACADPHLNPDNLDPFFGEEAEQFRALCNSKCTVQEECSDRFGGRELPMGVFGGEDMTQRYNG